MKRFLTTITALLLAVVAMAAAPDDTDSLMDVLNRTLSERAIFIRQKSARIDSLRRIVDSKHNYEERYDALQPLFDAYYNYSSDSALNVAEEREELARRMNDRPRQTNARMNQASVLAMTGMYKETLDIMDSLRLNYDERYLRPYYFYIMRTLYGNMTDYATRPLDRERYAALTDRFRDSLLSVNDPSSAVHALIMGDKLNAHGRYKEAIDTIYSYIRTHDASDRDMAVFAYTLSMSYNGLGDSKNEKRQLIISAINDLRTGVREYVSLRQLALMLYREGNVAEAYRLMRISLDDATKSNSRLRIYEINEVFPLINEMYVKALDEQQQRLRIMLWVIVALLAGLAVAVVYVLKLLGRARAAKSEADRANESLKKANAGLLDSSKQLKQANRTIAENSSLKTEYVGRYMDQSLDLIGRFDSYRKRLRRLLSAGKTAEVTEMLQNDEAISKELNEFYRNFDETFLRLFPTFIDDFNKLLVPEGRIIPKTEGSLTTELRIFALIRLDITDSVKIAKFLGYSVTTIYNYRTKVRNKALGDRDMLEAEVMKIGF